MVDIVATVRFGPRVLSRAARAWIGSSITATLEFRDRDAGDALYAVSGAALAMTRPDGSTASWSGGGLTAAGTGTWTRLLTPQDLTQLGDHLFAATCSSPTAESTAATLRVLAAGDATTGDGGAGAESAAAASAAVAAALAAASAVDANTAATTVANASAASFLFEVASASGEPRTIESKLRDVAHVFDFIPPARHAGLIANTDSDPVQTELQAAINAVEAAGGGTLQFAAARYPLSAGLTTTGKVRFQGAGMMGPGIAASQATSPETSLFALSSMSAMLTIQGATTGEHAWYVEIDGIYFRGVNLAERAIWLRSGRHCRINFAGERCTVAAVVSDDGNNALASYNNFPHFFYQAGSNAACIGSHGLVIEGAAGMNVGCTRHYGGVLDITAGANGVGLLLRDLDASYFAFASCGNQAGGSGHGIVFDTSADTTYGGAQVRVARKIYIGWVNGDVLARANTRNVIGWLNSEPSSVTCESNVSLHYGAIDRDNGMRFQTRSYIMSDRLAMPLLEQRTHTGTVSTVGTGGHAYPALRFADAATNAASWTVPIPPTWSEGNITGVRVLYSHPTSVADGNVVLQVDFGVRSVGEGLGSALSTGTGTIAVLGATVNNTREGTVTVSCPVVDNDRVLMLRLSRLGADAADTLADNFDVLGVDVVFEAVGPHGDPSPQWDVPVDKLV